VASHSVALYGNFVVEGEGSVLRLSMREVAEVIRTARSDPPAVEDGPQFVQDACTCGCGMKLADDVLYATQGDPDEMRAVHLLWSHLNTVQRGDFSRNGWFYAVGSHYKRRYKVGWGDMQNVWGPTLDGSHEKMWCLQVVGDEVPTGDAVLTQKILIESDEQRFLSTAF